VIKTVTHSNTIYIGRERVDHVLFLKIFWLTAGEEVSKCLTWTNTPFFSPSNNDFRLLLSWLAPLGFFFCYHKCFGDEEQRLSSVNSPRLPPIILIAHIAWAMSCLYSWWKTRSQNSCFKRKERKKKSFIFLFSPGLALFYYYKPLEIP